MSQYIAIIQTGQPVESVRLEHGDFDALFIKNMQVDETKTKTFNIAQSIEFPDTSNLAGIIITGSPAMVTEQLPWSEAIITWLKEIIELNIPVLGVCYGHQLLARAIGGEVNWNPNGRQIGMVQLNLNPAILSDLLFSHLVEKDNQYSINYYATHLQSVTSLPKKAVVLGSTKLDSNHCFRYKQHIWGLQFHPEFNADVIRHYVHARSDEILKENLNPTKILNGILHHDNGIQLLKRFRDICFS